MRFNHSLGKRCEPHPTSLMLVGLWLWIGSMQAMANPVYSTLLSADDPYQKRLEYRLEAGISTTEITANVGQQRIDFETKPYPYPTAKTAILILVDSSDPRRQAVVARIGQTLRQLIEQAGVHYDFGLATFDSDFSLQNPIGTARAEIQAATERLTAQGRTTELYRNTLVAIQTLAQYPASRRVLWLFSDGLAEDTDYHSQEVISAALQQQVMLVGFGYAPSVAATVHLQSMRRFASETGGLFFKANAQQQLPTHYSETLFRQMESGGLLVFDFRSWQGPAHPQLTVTWTTRHQTWHNTWPIQLPVRANEKVASSHAVPPYLWAALVVLLLLWLFLRHHQAHRERPVYAWLELIATRQHYAVNELSFTLGRANDNHLVLANDSVSSHHAVLHRNREGQWLISDLNSINGIYIKTEKVDHYPLQWNEPFELGEVALQLRAKISR